MDEIIFEYKSDNQKEKILMTKITDEDLLNGNNGTNNELETIEQLINYIKTNCNTLTEVTYENFTDDQILTILNSLNEYKDVQSTIHKNTYWISNRVIKKKVMINGKMDERTRRSNL